ncbi:MAG: pseudouridine synthase [Acidobacteriota bacterium]
MRARSLTRAEPAGEQRLHKIIAQAGLASRRQAEKMVLEGRVLVDGKVVKEPGATADPSRNDIRLDGMRVRPDRPRRYIVLNKPTGCVTTRSDPGRRPTVMELLPVSLRRLFPVGRLDMSTSGLLLLTDDGEFALRVSHPRYRVSKTYRLSVKGHPDQKALARARKGIRVEGQLLRLEAIFRFRQGFGETRVRLPASAVGRRPGRARGRKSSFAAGARSWLRVVLREGKNREIRRLFEALGHPVLELHRERVGPVSDRGLAPGAYRHLTRREVERLIAGPARVTPLRRKRGKKGP